MASEAKHKWTFLSRFRRHSFGWRSQPAIKRIKEAVSEIKKVARKDSILGGEGAVLFIERLSTAIEQVDSSSGSIGSTVYNAISSLVPIIAKAQIDDALRNKWLERLWEAVQDDKIPYLELLPYCWGELCATPEQASAWADDFIEIVRMMWGPDSNRGSYFEGTAACLSSLFKAGRNSDILELLELAPYKFWPYHQWGVKALAAMGEIDKALLYAVNSQSLNDHPMGIAQVCEELLLKSNRVEEAYDLYAIQANQKQTYVATFRAIKKKYPQVEPEQILSDLIASTPGEEGKWFASAVSVGLYDKAAKLANLSPCDPRTLTRAARDWAEQEPLHAIEYGITALLWIVNDYGYEITGADVEAAYNYSRNAARNAGVETQTIERIRNLIAGDQIRNSHFAKILYRFIEGY